MRTEKERKEKVIRFGSSRQAPAPGRYYNTRPAQCIDNQGAVKKVPKKAEHSSDSREIGTGVLSSSFYEDDRKRFIINFCG